MKSSIFNKSLKALIIVLLLLTVIFNRKLSQQLMLAAILVWTAVAISVFFRPQDICLYQEGIGSAAGRKAGSVRSTVCSGRGS